VTDFAHYRWGFRDINATRFKSLRNSVEQQAVRFVATSVNVELARIAIETTAIGHCQSRRRPGAGLGPGDAGLSAP
jgi:hypothetical protein